MLLLNIKILIFLSTSPAWGTTQAVATDCISAVFLSTSPAWGTTVVAIRGIVLKRSFYPRPPRGGRLTKGGIHNDTERFLSTSPAWGTTASSKRKLAMIDLSIHVPRVGDDYGNHVAVCAVRSFYPRPPRGGRRVRRAISARAFPFYPRPPRGGRHKP